MVQKVKVAITGTFRIAGGITVDKAPVPLNMSFSGSKDVDLIPPSITVGYAVKGAHTETYDIAITINNVTKHIQGSIDPSGFIQGSKDFLFSDFNLKVSS